MSRLKWFTLVLRAVMEAGVVAALAYWGYQTGSTTGTRILLAILAPLVGFGIWGLLDFHQFGRLAEPLRLLEELVISGMAAVALYAAGQHALGWALAGTSVAYHLLVYAQGDRLLRPLPVAGSPNPTEPTPAKEGSEP